MRDAFDLAVIAQHHEHLLLSNVHYIRAPPRINPDFFLAEIEELDILPEYAQLALDTMGERRIFAQMLQAKAPLAQMASNLGRGRSTVAARSRAYQFSGPRSSAGAVHSKCRTLTSGWKSTHSAQRQQRQRLGCLERLVAATARIGRLVRFLSDRGPIAGAVTNDRGLSPAHCGQVPFLAYSAIERVIENGPQVRHS